MVDVCSGCGVSGDSQTHNRNIICCCLWSLLLRKRFQVENCLSILSKWFFGAILAFIGKILWRTKAQTITAPIFIFHFFWPPRLVARDTEALTRAPRAMLGVYTQMYLNQIQCHTKEREERDESTERMALWLFYCQYRSFIRYITSNDPSDEIQMITGIDLNW